MYGVSLSWNTLAAARVDEPHAPSPDALSAAPREPDDGGSPGGLLQSMAAEPIALPGLVTTRESPFETRTVAASEDRLSKLIALLDSLKRCKCDLETQVETARNNKAELQEAAGKIRSAIESGNPIPESLLPILGSLGMLGMMVGLPVAPILGLFGISVGISVTYKERAERIAAELDRQAGQQEAAAEAEKDKLADVNRQIDSVEGQIAKEKARLEEAALPAHERAPGHKVMVRDSGWDGALADRDLISSSTPRLVSAWAIFSREPLLRD